MSLKLMYITNNPDVALIAEKYGVDRVWIDLETIGKEERQRGMNTVKSQHSVDDIRKIASLMTRSEVLVRVNPWNANSVEEINEVIDAGADVIMLPMWKSTDEVTNFINAVGGRISTMLLLETKEAAECLSEVLKLPGIDEIHIGLNDLHLSYGLTFMFELLSNGTIEMLCEKIGEAGKPYGFGGIARLGTGDLPAEKVIMEHYRLGSTRAILCRSFCNTDVVTELDEIDRLFCQNMKTLREYEACVQGMSKEAFTENKGAVAESVERIVAARRGTV